MLVLIDILTYLNFTKHTVVKIIYFGSLKLGVRKKMKFKGHNCPSYVYKDDIRGKTDHE